MKVFTSTTNYEAVEIFKEFLELPIEEMFKLVDQKGVYISPFNDIDGCHFTFKYHWLYFYSIEVTFFDPNIYLEIFKFPDELLDYVRLTAKCL